MEDILTSSFFWTSFNELREKLLGEFPEVRSEKIPDKILEEFSMEPMEMPTQEHLEEFDKKFLVKFCREVLENSLRNSLLNSNCTKKKKTCDREEIPKEPLNNSRTIFGKNS